MAIGADHCAPGGRVVAQIGLLNGVMRGRHHKPSNTEYGHREMGATPSTLDGVPMPYDPQIRAGINLNDHRALPIRQNHYQHRNPTGFLWRGSTSGLPAKISI